VGSIVATPTPRPEWASRAWLRLKSCVNQRHHKSDFCNKIGPSLHLPQRSNIPGTGGIADTPAVPIPSFGSVMDDGAIEERYLQPFDFLERSACNALQIAVEPGR
jgi:hypothetical protein